MQQYLIPLLLLLLSAPAYSQKIHGVIYYQNSGGRPAANIQVSAFGCETKYTQSNGMFILSCPQKSAGQKIKLLVGSTDGAGKSIEVVNTAELELIRMPKEADPEPVEIIICYAGQRDEAAMRYYGILSKHKSLEYDRKLQTIEIQLQKNTLSAEERKTLIAQIEELKAQRDSVLVQLEEQALLIASINQDKAPDDVKSAIRQIEQENNIEAALSTIFIGVKTEGMPTLDSPQTLRSKFAEVFDRPLDLIELNLPSADGRYPGTVLITPIEGQTLVIKREYRPKTLPKARSNISVALSGSSQSEMINKLIGNIASSDNLTVQIDLDDLRMFELDVSSSFKKSLLKDKSIHQAEKRGLTPRTIVRAYEAKITYSIQKNSSLNSGIWDKIKKDAIDVGGNLTKEGGISIKSDEPSVIAYESVLVNFIANNLDAGEPDEVIMKEYIVPHYRTNEINPTSFNLYPGDSAVAYFAWGNKNYESASFGNLKLVEGSIDLFSDVMKKAGATALFDTPPPSDLTTDHFERVIKEVSDRIIEEKRKSLFVFYYVGHAVAGPNGHLYLVLKDYKGNPKEDIGENYIYGLSREQLDEPSSPVSGSNISDLLDAINAMQTVYPEQIEGLYPVSQIEGKLRELEVPFVILVDACYSHNQMNQLRRQLSLTREGDYFGQRMDGGPEEVMRYAGAIRRFGNVPYLNSSNVVILSSAPGSIAVGVPNPIPSILKENFVGPLSRKIYDSFESVLLNGEPISYGDFFYSIVDVKELGEVKIHGATSWSDFSLIKKIEMLRKKR